MKCSLTSVLRFTVFAALLSPSLAAAQQAGVVDKGYRLPEPPDSLLRAISSLPQPQQNEILQAFRWAIGVTIRDFMNPTCSAYRFWAWRRANPGPPEDHQSLIARWGADRACLDPEIIKSSHGAAASNFIGQEPGMTAARRDAIGACVGDAMVAATMAMWPVNYGWLQQRIVSMIMDCKQKHPAPEESV